MQRSGIRECDAPFFPDSAALHPGYGPRLIRMCIYENSC